MALMALQEPFGPRSGPLSWVDLSHVGRGEERAGQRLRILREAAQYSLESLADEIGVALSTLRFWETEAGRLKRRRHSDYIKAVAKVLQVSELRIWQGDDPEDARTDTVPADDVSTDVRVLLARMTARPDVPTDLRSEAKDLLKALLDLN